MFTPELAETSVGVPRATLASSEVNVPALAVSTKVGTKLARPGTRVHLEVDGDIAERATRNDIATGAEMIKSRADTRMFGGERGRPADPCYHLASGGREAEVHRGPPELSGRHGLGVAVLIVPAEAELARPSSLAVDRQVRADLPVSPIPARRPRDRHIAHPAHLVQPPPDNRSVRCPEMCHLEDLYLSTWPCRAIVR